MIKKRMLYTKVYHQTRANKSIDIHASSFTFETYVTH